MSSSSNINDILLKMFVKGFTSLSSDSTFQSRSTEINALVMLIIEYLKFVNELQQFSFTELELTQQLQPMLQHICTLSKNLNQFGSYYYECRSFSHLVVIQRS